MNTINFIKDNKIVGLSIGTVTNILIMTLLLSTNTSFVVGALCITPIYMTAYFSIYCLAVILRKITTHRYVKWSRLLTYVILMIYTLTMVYVLSDVWNVLISLEGLVSAIVAISYDLMFGRN